MSEATEARGRTVSGRDGLPSEDDVAALRAELDDVRALLDRAEHGVRSPGDVATGPAGGSSRAPAHGPGAASGLDALDALLAPPEAPQGTVGRHRRPRPQVVPAALVLAAAGLAVAGALALPGRGPDPGAGRAPVAPVAAVGGDRPGVDAPGSDVTVEAEGSTVRVHETVVVADGELLRLVLPDPSAVPSSKVAAPRVEDVSARVGGVAVPARRSGSGWTVDPGGAGPALVDLRYTLTGAVERRTAGAGRALVVVAPLSAAASRRAGDPVLVRMSGARVLQASCLGARPDEELCGTSGADGWVARIPPSSQVPVVLLQVDLDV